jgi:Flp pilus assembly protein TadB
MPSHPAHRPVVITSAGQSPRQEQHGRQVQYAIIMGIRVVCFIVAIAVPIPAVRIVAVVGAFVLPWIGVVGANAVREKVLHGSNAGFVPEPRNTLNKGSDS